MPDVADTSDSSYVIVSSGGPESNLPNRRTITAGTNISVTDGGAGSTSTIALISSPTITTPTLTTPTVNGEKVAQVSKTANYTLTATDYAIRCDVSGGAFTITLPASASIGGAIYEIKRVEGSTNILTIDGNSSETIGGLDKWYLFAWESLKIISDGTNWQVLEHSNPSPFGYYFLEGSTANRRTIPGEQYPYMNAASTFTINQLWANPMILSKVQKFDTISAHVTTSQAAKNFRVGIYRDTGAKYPGVLIFDSGNISTASTGFKDTTITSGLQLMQPGLYWLVFNTDANTAQWDGYLPNAGMQILGVTSADFGALGSFYIKTASTFGALPDPFTASGTIQVLGIASPLIVLRPITS